MREMEENVYKVVQYVGKAAFEEAKGFLEGLSGALIAQDAVEAHEQQ